MVFQTGPVSSARNDEVLKEIRVVFLRLVLPLLQSLTPDPGVMSQSKLFLGVQRYFTTLLGELSLVYMKPCQPEGSEGQV